MTIKESRRPAFEQAVIDRMKEGGFLEVEIRVECLARSGDGYYDGSVDAYWHFWNAALDGAPVQQVSVPDGWKWVPVELTDKMHEAMVMTGGTLQTVYRAMLNAAPAAPAAQAYEIGIYGKAYDLPSKRRAYTYDEQPDSVVASRLACALSSVEPGGDSIDHGLSLLNQLQEAGFGVFELAAHRDQEAV